LNYQGWLSLDSERIPVKLSSFQPFCSPSEISLSFGDQVMKLPFHHVHTLVKRRRETLYWEKGKSAQIKVSILFPSPLKAIKKRGWRKRIKKYRVINLLGWADQKEISLEEIPWSTPFRVPAREKPLWGRFKIRLNREGL